MTNGIKTYRAFILSSLCITAVISVARLLLIVNTIELNDLENSGGLYYLENSSLSVTFACVCIGVCALFFVCGMLFTRKLGVQLNGDSAGVVFSSALVGLMLDTVAVVKLYEIAAGESKLSAMTVILLLFALSSSVYFLCIASRRVTVRVKKILPVLSLVPVVFVALRMLTDFVSRNLTVNASSYGYHLMSLAALMLFLCCEGRFTVGYKRKALYVGLGLTAATLISVYALPALYLALFWPLEFTEITLFSLVDVILVAYIFCRLLAFPKGEIVKSEVSVSKVAEVAASAE